MRTAARVIPSSLPRPTSVLSVEELAARWRVNRKSIYEAITRGELPVVRIGPRIIRVAVSVVESIESQGRVAPEGK